MYSSYSICSLTSLRKTEEEFQFLKNPINIPTFKDLAPTTTKFFEYGFVSITNDKAIQNICGEGNIVLKYETNIRPILLLNIKKDTTESNWIMEEKITNGYDIIFSINEVGIYDLEVSANIDKGNSYTKIVNIKVKCDTAPEIKKIYPEFTLDYKKEDDIKLISPKNNDLIQGNKYNFEIECSNYEQLYILVDQEYILMDKDGTKFIGKDVMIHGESVKISYLSSNLYYPLVTYSTFGTTVEFPKTSTTPFKKRLESPLENTLKIGNQYDFKIISDSEYNIVIYYNGKVEAQLDKNNNIYTKQITIESSADNTLKIMYGPLEGGTYKSMYTYNLSN